MSDHLTIDQAAAAVIYLINTRPQSPRPDEIEAILSRMTGAVVGTVRTPSDLAQRIRRAIDRAAEAELAFAEDDGGNPDIDAAVSERWAELGALEAQIPSPPRSVADIVTRAEIAFFCADKALGDASRMPSLESNDCFERASARLIMAVMQFAAAQGTAADDWRADLSASTDRIQEWRRREAEYLAACESKGSDDKADHALMAEFSAYTKSLWATQVRTWRDIALRVLIAQHWNSAPGVDDPAYPLWVLRDPDPSMDTLALAHVASAVLELEKGAGADTAPA